MGRRHLAKLCWRRPGYRVLQQPNQNCAWSSAVALDHSPDRPARPLLAVLFSGLRLWRPGKPAWKRHFWQSLEGFSWQGLVFIVFYRTYDLCSGQGASDESSGARDIAVTASAGDTKLAPGPAERRALPRHLGAPSPTRRTGMCAPIQRVASASGLDPRRRRISQPGATSKEQPKLHSAQHLADQRTGELD